MKKKSSDGTILKKLLKYTLFGTVYNQHEDNTFTVAQSQKSGKNQYEIAANDNQEWETMYDFSDSYVEDKPKTKKQIITKAGQLQPDNTRRNQFIILAILIIGLLSLMVIRHAMSKEEKKVVPPSKTKSILENGVCTFDEDAIGTVLYDDLVKVLEKDSDALVLKTCTLRKEDNLTIYKGSVQLLNDPWVVQVSLDVDKPYLELKSLSKQFGFGFPNLFSPCMFATIAIGFIESLRKINFCDSKINYKTFIYTSETKELRFTGESKMFGVFRYLTKHINGYHQFTKEELAELDAADNGDDSSKDIEKLNDLKTENAKRLKVKVSGTIRPHIELFFIYNFDMQFDIATIMYPMLYLNFKDKAMKFNSITILNINHEKEEETTDVNIKDPNTDFDPDKLRSLMDDNFKYDYKKLSEIIPSKYTERYLVLGNFGEISMGGFGIYGKLLKEFDTEILGKSLKIFNGEISFSINWKTKDTNKKFIDGSLLADMQMFNKTFFVNINLNPDANQPYFYVLFTNTLLKDCVHKDITKLDEFTDQKLDDENLNCSRYLESNDVRSVDETGYLPDLRGVFVLFLSKNNFEIEIKAINQTISFTDITSLTLAFNFNLIGSNSSKVLSVLKKAENKEDKFNLEFKGYISADKVQIKGELKNFYISEKFLLKDVLLIIQNKDPYVKITCKLLILEGAVDKEPREFLADIEIGDGYWYVYSSYDAEWKFTMFDEDFELNKVVFFLSKSETPSELPTKYLEELRTPGEEVENCGGIVGKLKANMDIGESNFDIFLIFSKCPDKTCLSIFVRKNDEDKEAGNVESLNSVFNKNQNFEFMKKVLPDGVYEDLFQNPPTDLTIEVKLICWEVKFRITLNSITFGKIKIAFDLLKLTDSIIEEQDQLDNNSEGKDKPLYRVSKNEEIEGFLFAFIILPEIDFNVENSSLFNGVPKLSIFPPTLVLSNKRLDVNIPFRLPITVEQKTNDNEEETSVVTKEEHEESQQKYIVYKTKPGLNIFARAKVKSNENLKVVEHFNINYVDLKGYIGTLGVEISVSIKGNWQINKYLTIYDSSLSIGVMKKNKNSKLTPFLKLQSTGIVKVLERQTLGSIVGDISSSGIYILAKVCKMVSVEDSKSKEGFDLFTEQDFNKCSSRKIDSFYDNNEQITEKNVDNYEDQENEQIKISIGNNRYIHIDTLQVEVRLLFSDIEISSDENNDDNSDSLKKQNKKSKGVSITVLARTKMPSFTLTVSLTVGSSFAIVLAFVPKTDKFIGFGTAINELLAKDPSQTSSITDMALPKEVTDAFNNKFQIKEFKASFVVANSTFEFKMKGMLKIHSDKYDALQTYDIDVFADEDNYRAQIINLEHPEDPPIDFIRDIAKLLGAKQVLVGVSKKPHLLEVPNTLDETGKPLKIYVTEGFYVMLVWSSQKPGEKEANSGNVTSKSGQSSLIVGGTFASISKWRLSLYINKSFKSGSMTFTFASLFVERRGTLFGVGFSLTCLFEFTDTERLYLLGELAVYMALSGDGPALGLKVAMLEDWVNPFGVNGLTIKKTTIEFILGLATLNPILFRLSGGVVFFSLNVDFLIYWDQTEAIDKKSVFYFKILNFNFTKLLEMAFGKNKFTAALGFIKIEFKYLEFKIATSTKSPTVVLDGTSYEVGFLLDIREFNFFDFLIGSLYFKFSKTGFHAKGNIKPFSLLGILKVSGVPDDAYTESKDDLRFELNTDPLNFRIYFSGKVVFLIFNIVGDIDISAKVFKVFLLINIDILSIDIIFIAIVKENLQNVNKIQIYLELMDNGFGNNKSGQDRFYAMRRKHGGLSAVEGMNERKKGNTIDNTIEEEKPYGDDVKSKRDRDKRKKEGELDDAEDKSGSIYQLKSNYYKNEKENKKEQNKNKLKLLMEELYNERKELNKLLYENKNREKIMQIKYKIDKLKYLIRSIHEKNNGKDEDLRNGVITADYQIQMWWIFDAIVNFFKRLINAIKKLINAIVKLINIIVDIIKKIIKFIISLLKKLITIAYLIGYTEIEPRNKSANVTVFIDILLFSKWHIKVCETISFGSVKNVEKATGVVSKENDDDLQGSKKEADHERGTKIVNQKEAGIIQNNVVKQYDRDNERKRQICEGKGF
eukprot:GAHX01001074.1.p1 GENE.GAHX01001074.1~~GAHX01001074.1.p1  ORF type:complete len:2107 (+),score=501.92 GAHX01001074.1:89-6409(+)